MPPPTDKSATEALARLCGRSTTLPLPATMLVLAHPDDETVGAATLLPKLSGAKLVYVTDGAPLALDDAQAAGCRSRDEYAQVRRGELLSALDSVGIPQERVEFVDCVDQQVTAQLPKVTRWLEILIRDYAPTLVLTHPYEGGHPDHDATAFAVHVACGRIAAGGGRAPAIAEFTSYHAAAGRWEFATFLPGPTEIITHSLTDRERRQKRQLIGCYASQRRVLEAVPLEVERYRVAPVYDFFAPPHSGALLYETFGWEMDGTAWRTRAKAALAELSEDLGRPESLLHPRLDAEDRFDAQRDSAVQYLAVR